MAENIVIVPNHEWLLYRCEFQTLTDCCWHIAEKHTGKLNSKKRMHEAFYRLTIIVKPTGNNHYLRICCAIHQTICIIYTPRPITRQIATQWLWFANTCEWVTRSSGNQYIYPFQRFLVLSMTIQISVPRVGHKVNAPHG